MDQIEIRKGSTIEVEIDSLAYGGKGIARVGELVVFVKNAIPGQKVKALIYRKKKGYAEARPLEVLHESSYAVKPRCRHFPVCGGCQIQQLEYEQQLEQKRRQVTDVFQRIAGLSEFRTHEIIPAGQIFQYRNKMEFSFSNRRWVLPGEPDTAASNFALGLHIPKRFDKILDIEECHIQQPLGNEILALVRTEAKKNNLKPYDAKTHIGFLRHLALRFGINTGDVMVNLVTSYENTDPLQPIVTALVRKFPGITAIINNINTRKADVAFGEKEILLYGMPTITERIGNLNFEISANSFFQTNTKQTEKLYGKVLKYAGLTGTEIVYDLYCGTGSISLFLAAQAKEIHGFEVIVSAIENAERNAAANNIDNCFFHKANLDTYFKNPSYPKNLPNPDLVIVDPPRAGMHENMVKYLHRFGARQIIYISCNPATQARDTLILNEQGYQLKQLTMLDMFPHTAHIETVALFLPPEYPV